MPALKKQPRYQLRATMRGKLTYLCPICGVVQEHRVDWRKWRLRCINEDCHRVFAVGLVFRPLAGHNAPGSLPPDMAFPRVPVIRPRGKRAPLHELGDPIGIDDGDTIDDTSGGGAPKPKPDTE